MINPGLSVFESAALKEIDLEKINRSTEKVERVNELHHLLIWELAEHHRTLAAQIAVSDKEIHNIDRINT